jgi:hypothetical protein
MFPPLWQFRASKAKRAPLVIGKGGQNVDADRRRPDQTPLSS